MSRRKVNGVWIDEGPGAGRMTGQLGEGKSSLLHGPGALESDGGGEVGRIERRQVWAAQAEVVRSGVIAVSHVIPPAQEEPVMPEPSSVPVEGPNASPAYNAGAEFEGDVDDGYEPSGDSLEDAMAVMADALAEAMEARGALAKAVRRWADARQALEACWEATGLGPDVEPPDHLPMQEIELGDGTVMRAHSDGAPETIAALRELGEAAVVKLRSEAESELRELVHDEGRASVALDGETQVVEPFAPVDPSEATSADSPTNIPKTIPVAAPGRDDADLSRLTAHQRRVLAAAIKNGGDSKATAIELGLTGRLNVELALESIAKKGLLPIELIPKLPARFAKYTGA